MNSSFFYNEPSDELLQLWLQGTPIVNDDEICHLEQSLLGGLLPHTTTYLLLSCPITLNSTMQTYSLRSRDHEQAVHDILETGFHKDGTLQSHNTLVHLAPTKEIRLYGRMDDGIHLCCVRCRSKEVAGHHGLAELALWRVGFLAQQTDQRLVYFRGFHHQTTSCAVAVIDRNAEMLRQLAGNIALAAANASCDADSHSPGSSDSSVSSTCSMRNCTTSGLIRTCETPSGMERSCRRKVESGREISSS